MFSSLSTVVVVSVERMLSPSGDTVFDEGAAADASAELCVDRINEAHSLLILASPPSVLCASLVSTALVVVVGFVGVMSFDSMIFSDVAII